MILALDFDGVVWDSVGECYQMARRACGRDLPECETAFRSGRWLVRCGGDFLLVLELAAADPTVDLTDFSKTEFARLCEARGEEMDRFSRAFYGARERCRQEEPEAWLAMQRPYPAFVAQVPALQRHYAELVVCTTKDEASARQLLATVGLDVSIWGKEHGTEKGEQVRDLCRQRGINANQVQFVDDLLDNLEQVRPTGARLWLADWGYNTPAEQAEARQRGIAVVSPEQLCGS